MEEPIHPTHGLGSAMNHYIEVRGQAPVTETIVEYRADLTVTVRATKVETALSDAEELRNQCIRTLKEAGRSDSELVEGVGQVWRPWFWKKKAGEEVSRKILVTCNDVDRIQRAFAALEPIFANQRFSLSVSMLAPRFQSLPKDQAAAQKAAVEHARQKAQVIAETAEVNLGPVVQVEEIDEHLSRSGTYGDEEWRWYADAAVASEPHISSERLDNATRSRMLRFRVRFELPDGSRQ